MADIKVKDLTDTQTINTDNEIMVLTNKAQNQVQNITVGNLLSNVLSSDNDNVLEQGTDGKLYVETPENITGDLSDLSTTEKSSLVAAINEVDGDITTEATTRANADNNLQSQIDAITAASDVTDIVGTYAELQAYDTTGLANNSIIKVLQDESRQDETAYYRWVITGGVGAWVLIGEEGPYYTKSQSDSKFATQATVGNLSNLATSDKSSVVNAMNELASVLDPTQTADYIKNSKAIYSGEVSENALILPQIKEMSHSTFDLSKFTIVGSPIITDTGNASGFGNSNKIQIPYTIQNDTNFTINGSFTFPSTIDYSKQYIVLGLAKNGSDTFLLEYRVISGTLGGLLYSNGENSHEMLSYNLANEVPAIPNKTYNYKIIVNGTNITLDVEGVIKTANDFYPAVNTSFYVGCDRNGNNPFDGSIDLKGVNITANAVEVFSGNKTGIDTIKPDDYTVVGTPTISADGVASGFSSSNYINATSIDLTGKKELILESYYTAPTKAPETATQECLLRCGAVCLATNLKTTNFDIGARIPLKYATRYSLSNLPYDGSTYVIQGVFDLVNNSYYCRSRKIDEVTWTTSTSESTDLSSAQPSVVMTGLFNTSGNYILPYLGSGIDLNTQKIYVDGNLVYQPCLKIPYTEAGNGKGYNASTGSKIVNAIYRDRVADMYEQYGYAPYYTLSDTDFTLPQGEIYGYIEKRARDIAHPVGVPFYRFSDEINEDEVRLEGAEVDKGLYLAIEQNLSAYCTAGSTSDKICLPDFRNRVPWGANSQGYIEAGLPNITGSFQPNQGTVFTAGGQRTGYIPDNLSNGLATGAFDIADKASGDGQITFDASRSSSIYNDNVTTVQPPAFKVRWLARFK